MPEVFEIILIKATEVHLNSSPNNIFHQWVHVVISQPNKVVVKGTGTTHVCTTKAPKAFFSHTSYETHLSCSLAYILAQQYN